MSELPLTDGFSPANATEWRGLIDKILKGADYDRRLVTRTADGIAIKPLYTRDVAPLASTAFMRGRARPSGAWDIRQVHADADPAAANAAILDDLAGGVTSILLQIEAPGWAGLNYTGPSIARALHDVLLDVCPIALRAGEYTPDAAGSLMAVWRAASIRDGQCLGAFHYDPLGTLALTGSLYQPLDTALAVAADLVKTCQPMPGVSALLADGQIWHRGGASEAQEVGLVLAGIVAYLRACERRGVAAQQALPKIALTLAIDADQFLGLAKLRALRRCLARIAESCGASSVLDKVSITAETSVRMLSRRDPWVNILRSTMACTTAALGGADAITVLPFSWALGQSDARALRIARNTQIVLQEESGLGRVQDPAGGSWYVDRLTEDLAQAAWRVFQTIEAGGGLGQALVRGEAQALLAAQTERRADDLARGKSELTGTSAFPNLGEAAVACVPWPAHSLTADLAGARVKPLNVQRLAEPFEALRDAADAARAAGHAPRLFLATLGPLAVHAARAAWVRNFLASGGIDAVGDQALHNSADAGLAFAQSGATIACLCSSDAVYAELAEATIGALKAAGADVVYMAGRQADEAPFRAAGVDAFIVVGADRIAALQRLQRELGFGRAP